MGNDYTATLKSTETEEFIDIYFYRPIGYWWARLFRRLGIHPNTVTILSILLGMAAGYCFYFKDLYINVIGMLLLIWANMYDSADGQLARMTGQKTELGRMLDGFAGDLWFFSIYFAICMRLNDQWGIWIWLIAAFAGFICHAKQCQLADYYRNIHLFFLKGEAGSELRNSQNLESFYQTLSWKKDLIAKAFQFFYIRYTRSQEQMAPAFQTFYKQLSDESGHLHVPPHIRESFLEGSRPLMKYTNILTFNTRAIALFLSLFIDEPWLYFVFEITLMSFLFFYMRHKHETLCKRLYKELTSSSNA